MTPAAPPPVQAAHAPDRELTSFQEQWPVEYVLRPQTIPEGAVMIEPRTWYFRPQALNLRTPDGRPYAFHPNLAAGVGFAYGATERLQVGIGAPRILCSSQADPSGCSSYNRFNGSDVYANYGLVRSRPFQLLLAAALSISRSDPVTFSWSVAGRAKVLFGHTVDLELALTLNRPIDSSTPVDQYPSATFVSDLNVQLTTHLLIYGDLDPYAPLDHLGTPALEGLAGGSWTFDSRIELGLYAGIYNLLSLRSWQTAVPGSFYDLFLRCWL